MIYVKVKQTEENTTLYTFGCKGYGWCHEKELDKDIVFIQCDDDYKGARGYRVNRKDIEICKEQKVNPYNREEK